MGLAHDDGARGVLVAGSTGEGTLLRPEQRATATRTARRALPAGSIVLAGASGATVQDLVEDVVTLADAGADAVLVLAPHTYPLRPDELVDLHATVAEETEVPTLAYHIPQLTGSALTPTAMVELAGHPGVIGCKDSSPDAERRTAFLEAVDGHPFAVLTGHAPSCRQALEAGAAGAILAIANLRQRRASALHEAVSSGDTAAAARHQDALAATATALASIDASTPAALKAALQLTGSITERWCRPPLRSLTGKQLDRVRTALLR